MKRNIFLLFAFLLLCCKTKEPSLILPERFLFNNFTETTISGIQYRLFFGSNLTETEKTEISHKIAVPLLGMIGSSNAVSLRKLVSPMLDFGYDPFFPGGDGYIGVQGQIAATEMAKDITERRFYNMKSSLVNLITNSATNLYCSAIKNEESFLVLYSIEIFDIDSSVAFGFCFLKYIKDENGDMSSVLTTSDSIALPLYSFHISKEGEKFFYRNPDTTNENSYLYKKLYKTFE